MVHFDWNGCSTSIGISGPLGLEYAIDQVPNLQWVMISPYNNKDKPVILDLTFKLDDQFSFGHTEKLISISIKKIENKTVYFDFTPCKEGIYISHDEISIPHISWEKIPDKLKAIVECEKN